MASDWSSSAKKVLVVIVDGLSDRRSTSIGRKISLRRQQARASAVPHAFRTYPGWVHIPVGQTPIQP